MKFKSYKTSWATVLCAAAVLSVFTSVDARAGQIAGPVTPPSGTINTSDQTTPPPTTSPVSPSERGVATGETFTGSFRGTMMAD